VYLWNWRDIMAALGLRNTAEARRRLRHFNDIHNGPILMPRAGGQPMVERNRLLAWWNSLQLILEAAKQRCADQHATTANQHAYGRQATVVPDLAGSVKKRRARRRSDSAQPVADPKNGDDNRHQDCGGGPTLAT
jgi:hypothetical protein